VFEGITLTRKYQTMPKILDNDEHTSLLQRKKFYNINARTKYDLNYYLNLTDELVSASWSLYHKLFYVRN